MDAAVPAVEVADHADAVRVGRPDGEMHADGGSDVDPVRAQLLQGAVLRPLVEQVQIVIGQDAPVPVRIVDLGDAAVAKDDPQTVVGRLAASVLVGHVQLEHPVGAPRHRTQIARRQQPHVDRARRRPHHADDRAAAGLVAMRSENREGIAVGAAEQRRKGALDGGVAGNGAFHLSMVRQERATRSWPS